MISISYEEFVRLVTLRREHTQTDSESTERTSHEKVVLPDQEIRWVRAHDKRMATCPSCDAVVDADILHPRTGLCPICHEETQLRSW